MTAYQLVIENFGTIIQGISVLIAPIATYYAYKKKMALDEIIKMNQNDLKLKIEMLDEIELRNRLEQEHMQIHIQNGSDTGYKLLARNLAQMHLGKEFNTKFTPKRVSQRRDRYKQRLESLIS